MHGVISRMTPRNRICLVNYVVTTFPLSSFDLGNFNVIESVFLVALKKMKQLLSWETIYFEASRIKVEVLNYHRNDIIYT